MKDYTKLRHVYIFQAKFSIWVANHATFHFFVQKNATQGSRRETTELSRSQHKNPAEKADRGLHCAEMVLRPTWHFLFLENGLK